MPILIIIGAILPNLFGIILNLSLYALIKRKVNKFLVVLILFITNEIAFSLYEKRIILFGIFPPKVSENIIPTDSIHYLLISITSIIAATLISVIKLPNMEQKF
jgi:hypothetical protein